MSIAVTKQPAPCGAHIRGVDLTQALSLDEIAQIRAAWLQHQVIAFPDQDLAIADIERFATYMGPPGEDPYIESIAGHPRVVPVKREAEEKTPIFAETWHSDWSFLPRPPAPCSTEMSFLRAAATLCSQINMRHGKICRAR